MYILLEQVKSGEVYATLDQLLNLHQLADKYHLDTEDLCTHVYGYYILSDAVSIPVPDINSFAGFHPLSFMKVTMEASLMVEAMGVEVR